MENLKDIIVEVFVEANNKAFPKNKITNDDLYWEIAQNCEFLCIDGYDVGISIYNNKIGFNEGTPWEQFVKLDNIEQIKKLTAEIAENG